MICVDASVAAKWILAEEYSDKALRLYQDAVANGQSIVAPTLLPYEVTNILRLRTLRGSLPAGQAQPLLAQYLTFPIRLLSPETLHREALRLSESFALPAAYDAHYLALAQLLSCELWTDDRRLLRQLGGKLTFVRAIGEYA